MSETQPQHEEDPATRQEKDCQARHRENTEHWRNIAQIIGAVATFFLLVFSIVGFFFLQKSRQQDAKERNRLAEITLLKDFLPKYTLDGEIETYIPEDGIAGMRMTVVNDGLFSLVFAAKPTTQSFDCNGNVLSEIEIAGPDRETVAPSRATDRNLRIPLPYHSSVMPRLPTVIYNEITSIGGYSHHEISSIRQTQVLIVRFDWLVFPVNHVEISDLFDDLDPKTLFSSDEDFGFEDTPAFFNTFNFWTVIEVGNGKPRLLPVQTCQGGIAKMSSRDWMAK